MMNTRACGRIALLFGLLLGCGSNEPASVGALGGACLPDGTCDGVLACVDGTCVASDTVGELGSPCFADGTCTSSESPCEDMKCVAKVCTSTPVPAGTMCRESAGVCDAAELCDGASATCPADALSEAGSACRASAGVCDVAEVCDGVSAACPVDALSESGSECRALAGACDVAEVCDGVSAACPVDTVLAAGTPGVEETCTPYLCDGAQVACPDACTETAQCVAGHVCQDGVCSDLGALMGVIWFPGNAPGMVVMGQELAVHNARVSLHVQAPAPVAAGVGCTVCTPAEGPSTWSGSDGSFVLENVPAGTYWLVLEKGKFRRDLEVTISAGETLELTNEQSTLPSLSDPENGAWTPRIALASAFWDKLEQLLGKMGMGAVDTEGEFLPETAQAAFDVYSNGGALDGVAIDTFANLLQDMNAMRQYDVILVGCSQETFPGTGLSSAPVVVLENLRQYVQEGGVLVATDWSADVIDNVFPEQIRFASSHDTPASAWNGMSWNTSQFGTGNGFEGSDAQHAYVVDSGLYDWLNGQSAPLLDGFESLTPGVIDGHNLALVGVYNLIEELVPVQLGQDAEGLPVFDTPYAWVIGDQLGTPASCAGGVGCSPELVSFQPVGCGHVVYSSFHTLEFAHPGLSPQERLLLYVLLELGACQPGS